MVTSVLGRFVRRCRLEYAQLDFDAANRLWEIFTLAIAPDHNIAEETRATHQYPLSWQDYSGWSGPKHS
jgi:hypothetical protein